MNIQKIPENDNGAHREEAPLPIGVSGLKFPEPVGKGLDRLADGSLKKTKRPRAPRPRQ